MDPARAQALKQVSLLDKLQSPSKQRLLSSSSEDLSPEDMASVSEGQTPEDADLSFLDKIISRTRKAVGGGPWKKLLPNEPVDQYDADGEDYEE